MPGLSPCRGVFAAQVVHVAEESDHVLHVNKRRVPECMEVFLCLKTK